MSEASKPDRARWVLLAAVVGGGVVIDQVTKYLAHIHVRGRGIVPVIDGFFELRYARNPGAFFSLGADLSPGLRRWIFVGASIAASALIMRLYVRSSQEQRVLRFSLLFLLTGALGNLVDRALYGEVIDFAHVYWRGVFNWATFNVADAFITFGLLGLFADLVLPRRAPPVLGTSEPPSSDSSSPTEEQARIESGS